MNKIGRLYYVNMLAVILYYSSQSMTTERNWVEGTLYYLSQLTVNLQLYQYKF